MDKTIEISVLMSVYNGELYIKEAIESILAQTFTNFEFIIINDASKDRTSDIIRSFNEPRIVIIEHENNLGLIGSLNEGLSKARGRYIARLDHDDIALPKRLQIQYDFMNSHPDIHVVGSWTECIDPSGKTMKISRNPSNPVVIQYEMIFNNVLLHSSIFFRTDTVRKNGGYSKEFIHAEDFEMYSRPDKELRCDNIPEVLFKLRIHSSSITGSGNTQPLVYVNALNIIYRNINQYLSLPREHFDAIVSLLIVKRPDTTIGFKNFILSLSVLKKITDAFIVKNKLNDADRNLILERYRGRRHMMIKHYLLGKYRKIFK